MRVKETVQILEVPIKTSMDALPGVPLNVNNQYPCLKSF